ncbi:MAG: 3-hydroxyacyl-ACP dehydratase FabZ family protein [Verrucomicrobiota bacterium]|jgi:3-hydroxyacyl-[acyl-carrier-protein] dehydratase
MNPPADMLETALQTLPHGPEFRFIDRLISLTPGKEGVGEYRVRGDEPFLRGHFPGDPIFPGVLLVEAAAQLAGIVAQSDPSIPPLGKLKLAALSAVKILGTLCPGETMRVQALIVGRLAGLVQARAQIHVRDRLVLTAGLTLGGSEPK